MIRRFLQVGRRRRDGVPQAMAVAPRHGELIDAMGWWAAWHGRN